MEQWADTLVEAIDAALSRQPDLVWLDLSFRQRAEAIEREVVRLEAEAMLRASGIAQVPRVNGNPSPNGPSRSVIES